MQGGDISNAVTPRLLVVFEGLVALPGVPGRASRLLRVLRGSRSPRDVVQGLSVNAAMAAQVWDLAWRQSLSVDLVTYLAEGAHPEPWREAIEDWVDENNLPLGRVEVTTAALLARSLAYRPDVLAVLDPDPARRLTYGSKGRLVDPSAPNVMKVL